MSNIRPIRGMNQVPSIEQRQGGNMQSLQQIMVPGPLEQTIQERTWVCLAGVQDDANGVKFVRKGCGVIHPKVLDNKYVMRLRCPCEKAAFKAYEEHKARVAWQKEQLPLCYDWLGGAKIAEDMAKLTFESFDRSRQPDAYDMMLAFADDPSGVLILHGQYGIGKTHLAAALCNHLRMRKENPVASRFCTVSRLFNASQEATLKSEPTSKIINRAINAPVLVLDDVGTAKLTEFREDILFQIIDTRTLKHLPIVISMNFIDKLEDAVGGRCASRLQRGQIAIEMRGDDYRMQL